MKNICFKFSLRKIPGHFVFPNGLQKEERKFTWINTKIKKSEPNLKKTREAKREKWEREKFQYYSNTQKCQKAKVKFKKKEAWEAYFLGCEISPKWEKNRKINRGSSVTKNSLLSEK